jgi:predicted small lipoprotein YifL
VVQEFNVSHYNFTMLRFHQILVSAIVLAGSVAGLCACGQQGSLYLPAEPAAAKRPATQTQAVDPATKPSAPATQTAPQ